MAHKQCCLPLVYRSLDAVLGRHRFSAGHAVVGELSHTAQGAQGTSRRYHESCTMLRRSGGVIREKHCSHTYRRIDAGLLHTLLHTRRLNTG